jgi:hypothetical protein
MMMIGCFILYGTLFTWLCAAIGWRLLSPDRCRLPSRFRYAQSRVFAIEQALREYKLDWNECPPNRNALIDGGYLDARNFTDPWDKAISFTCSIDGEKVVSAGPDHEFGTADDVKNER